MPERRSPAAWWAALAWCAVAGWIVYVRGSRVPLLSLVDLGFHELGHLIMYVLPINDVLTAAMGSINQCAVPCGIAAYFWFRRNDRLAAAVCMAWAATNLQDASVYIADAPYQRLELLGGGEHDWAFVLGPDHLNQLQNAHTIARVVWTTGLVVLFGAIAIVVRGLTARSAASVPVAATAPRSDDLFPSR